MLGVAPAGRTADGHSSLSRLSANSVGCRLGFIDISSSESPTCLFFPLV